MDEKNNLLERELRSMTESAKEKIRHITEDVYKRVAQTLNDEIKRYDDKRSKIRLFLMLNIIAFRR